MKVHSIISNTISEEILQTGHLSIRFLTDGFSLLLEGSDYRPVILNRFTSESPISLTGLVMACEDWLERHTLLEEFEGETTISSNDLSSTLVPNELFSELDPAQYLLPVTELKKTDFVTYKKIKNRPFTLVYSISAVIRELSEKFPGKTRITHPSEILLSMADQVNASDHQRGFTLVEHQNGYMGILVIKDDQVKLLNHLSLKNRKELIFHILNTVEKIGFDRRQSPLFYSGDDITNELDTLKKYISNIQPLSYYILDIDRDAIPANTMLAESTKCE